MPAHALFSSHHVARAFKSLLPLSAEGFPLSSPQVSCLHTSSPALKACSQVLKFCLVSVFCCLLLGVFVLELSYLTQKLSWDQARIKCFFDNTALGHGGSKALRDSKRSLSGSIFHRVASKFRGDGCHANDLQASKWLYMVKSDFQMNTARAAVESPHINAIGRTLSWPYVLERVDTQGEMLKLIPITIRGKQNPRIWARIDPIHRHIGGSASSCNPTIAGSNDTIEVVNRSTPVWQKNAESQQSPSDSGQTRYQSAYD
ncbi:hypothetical protein K438DRAFT_1936271 [Mycena galopus ATCC 62051]|nr:hypothetical protein K438DRAFT_1936271 [Mycena galopus ATCC 62051]